MSTLVLRPHCSVYIRLNNDIIFVDFDTKSLSLYDIESDTYFQQELSYIEEGDYIFYVQARTVRAVVRVNPYEQQVIINAEDELLYFEQEVAEHVAL